MSLWQTCWVKHRIW